MHSPPPPFHLPPLHLPPFAPTGGTGLYHRCDPLLPHMVLLDDVNAMKDLQEFAKTVDLTDTFRFVDDNFRYDPSASNEDSGMHSVHCSL